MTVTSVSALFKPLRVGRYTVANRIFMAPLARVRATPETHVPLPIMVRHYADRASSGLIIAEGAMVQEGYSCLRNEVGIYSKEQIAAWKAITDAVHAKGGIIFLQLMHAGRAGQVDLVPGGRLLAPSAIGIEERDVPQFFSQYGTSFPVPHAMTPEEIDSVKAAFVQAAKNAMEAGFDGVEVHGGDGYLLDQFWRDSTNTRDAPYGGSLENRARLIVEITKEICDTIGADRTAVRLSPIHSKYGQRDSQPEQATRCICAMLSPLKLAFLDIVRQDRFKQVKGDVLQWVKESYTGGAVVSGMGYTPAEAAADVDAGLADAVAFGDNYVANPDLVERIQVGASLNPVRPAFYHSKGEEGYNDYSTLAEMNTDAAAEKAS